MNELNEYIDIYLSKLKVNVKK